MLAKLKLIILKIILKEFILRFYNLFVVKKN